MIRAILFDVDQVLVNLGGKYFTVHLEEQYNIPQNVTAPFFEGEFMDCIVGKKDLKEILPKYIEEWGWKGTLEELLHFWHTSEHIVNEPLMEELTRYRGNGIKVYLATNQEKYRMEYILNEMGFRDIFDDAFASAHLGHRKPAKECFQSILQSLVIFEPQDILFWDYLLENVEAAREVGLHAEQYQNFEHFKQVMDQRYHL
jgi:putative hydrolase of the HAD superfamily